jgi:ribosomal protein S12 methylthiotransferase accessory factor
MMEDISCFFREDSLLSTCEGEARFLDADMELTETLQYLYVPVDTDSAGDPGNACHLRRGASGAAWDYPACNMFHEKHVVGKLGILKSLKISPPEKTGIPFYICSGAVANTETLTGRSFSFGFSTGCAETEEKAKAAAIGEGLERYCASIMQEKNPPIFCSYGELTEEGIHPGEFSLFSEKQYKSPGFPYMPFDENTPTRWVKGFRITENSLTDREILIPAPFVFMPYKPVMNGKNIITGKNEQEPNITPHASAGLGCGRTLEAAILSGLYECIERHALALFWNRMEKREALRWDEAKTILLQRGITIEDSVDLQWRILDLTGESGIPVFWGFVFDRTDGLIFASGSACRLNGEEAVFKTITEINHNRVFIKETLRTTGSPDFLQDYTKIASYRDHALFYNFFPSMLESFRFVFDGASKSLSPDKTNNESGCKETEQCKEIYHIVKKLNRKILYTDITTSDVKAAGFRTVRVTVPGFIYPSPVYGQEFLGCKEIYTYNREADGINILPHPFA